MPKIRSTQQSCSMSFSPGNRGEPFSNSPRMQPTALWIQTQIAQRSHTRTQIAPRQLRRLTPRTQIFPHSTHTRTLEPRHHETAQMLQI